MQWGAGVDAALLQDSLRCDILFSVAQHLSMMLQASCTAPQFQQQEQHYDLM